MAELAIRTHELTRSFATVRALDNLTLEVPAGSVLGFLGSNGAGKTTTIRLLLGLIEPSAGKAEVLGFDTRSQGGEIRARSGALLEYSGLYERMSAEDNLRFYGRVARMTRGTLDQRIHELLTHLGLWDRRSEAVVKWSRGMKQKLAIARTLLHRPALVFLDEPTAGLVDPVAAAGLRDDLAALASREGATIFLTTHNLAEAEKLCNLVAVIRQGKLLALGSPHHCGDCRFLRRGAGTPHARNTARQPPLGSINTIRQNRRIGRLRMVDLTLLHPGRSFAVNAANWHGKLLMFHDAASWLTLLLGPPLLGGLVATAGVLVSLHSTTVRQAQQTLGIGLVVSVFLMGFGSNMLPAEWKTWLTRIVFTWSQTDLVLAAAGVLLAIDIAFLFAGMARFQRARLVLD